MTALVDFEQAAKQLKDQASGGMPPVSTRRGVEQRYANAYHRMAKEGLVRPLRKRYRA